jgi:hypothetical protein
MKKICLLYTMYSFIYCSTSTYSYHTMVSVPMLHHVGVKLGRRKKKGPRQYIANTEKWWVSSHRFTRNSELRQCRLSISPVDPISLP